MMSKLFRLPRYAIKSLGDATSSKISSRWLSSAPKLTFNEALKNLPPTEVSTLESGIKIASEDNGSSTATVGVFIGAGSRFESPTNSGVSRFFEHLACKGTVKYSQDDLEKEIGKLGARLDAFTEREVAAFTISCSSEDVPKAVELLADITLNSKFDEAEVERQRNIILQKMENVEKVDYEAVADDFLHMTAYQHTPLSKSVWGTEESIRSITKQDIADHLAMMYRPERMVLAGAGGINHQMLSQLGEEHFKNKPPLEFEIPHIARSFYTGSDLRHRDDAIEKGYVAIAVEGVPFSHTDNIPMMIGKCLVGSCDNAEAGQKHDPCDITRLTNVNKWGKFKSFNYNYADTGLWGVSYIGNNFDLSDFMEFLQDDWMDLCVSLKDFDVLRGKNLLRTELILKLEGNNFKCHDIGKQVLANDVRLPLDELNARIEHLDTETIRETLHKYIYDSCIVIGAYGRLESLMPYVNIRMRQRSFFF